jgi:DNA-binding beta-propeller fold protein YncE
LLSSAFLLAWVGCSGTSEPTVTKLGTVDVPGRSCEILQVRPSDGLILATNATQRRLDAYRMTSRDPLTIEPVDLAPADPAATGLALAGEPSSVAIHPSGRTAVVAVLIDDHASRGRLVTVDLAEGRLGTVLAESPCGYGPDSLAFTPDGGWLMVACEAEGDPNTPGSIELHPYDPNLCRPCGMALMLDEFPQLDPAGSVTPAGRIEPEYVAVAPDGRFAAVTCQDNDAVVLVDLRAAPGALHDSSVALLPDSQPDGVAILDGVRSVGALDKNTPLGSRMGWFMAVAEEGTKASAGQGGGHAVSFWWVGQVGKGALWAWLQCRMPVGPIVSPDEPDARCDPEGVALARLGDRIIACVTVERADCLIVLDATETSRRGAAKRPGGSPQRVAVAPHPKVLAVVPVGTRPEGVVIVPDGEGLLVFTADEGDEGPGEISVVRIAP